MADPSQASSALDPRALSADALARLPVDLDSLPKEVLARLEERARAPDRRLMVGRYVIAGELGRGGMGVVYDAWDPGIERRVAIKTIEPDLVAEEDREEVIERFKRETKIVGRLHHPGIVTIFDYGEERESGLGSKLYYYVMEYLEGQSLARILRERRTLPDIEAVTIVADVLEALHVSHAAGVIHRDIKPSNIFLRAGVQAVLLDFGIAKTDSVALTRQGQILGTPSYLAPERLREKEIAVDGRADIFSLGVLLFTMLTGEAPFVGEDVYDVIDKIAKQSHPKLARTTPSGQALSRVIDKMLAKRPEDRYATANESAMALRNVLTLLRATNPEISDLLTGVRVRDEMPETATEIATPSSALPAVGDEEDTGRQQIGIRSRGESDSQNVSLIEEVGPSDGATELAASEHPIRMADLLGTRPELALIRETVEIDREQRSAPPPLPVRASIPPPLIETTLDAPKTTPGLPAYSEGHEGSDSGEYESHSEANDETTDDQTIADPDAGKTELKPSRHSVPPPLPPATKVGPRPTSNPAFSALSPAQAKSPSGPAALPSKPPTLPPPLKNPSGPAAVVPSGKNAIPSAAKTPSGSNAVPPLNRTPSLSRGEERATETFARAASPEHSEQKTEADRGRPAVRGGKSLKGRRSRIEASLVDEDDVVVKPAPLDTLKPDEMPTQTGFRVPPGASTTIPPSASIDEVVRVRGESRIPDPAEAPQEAPTQGGAMIGAAASEGSEDPTGDRDRDADRDLRERERDTGDLELDDGSGPIPELDAPRSSAAVARRTFGARNGGAAGGNLAAARAKTTAGNVHVRVSGTFNADRMRLVRRRGFMLVIAMLAAIAVGLFLGRLKQRSAADESDQPKPIVVEPRVSRSQPGLSEPELIKPRPASELIQEATVALGEQNFRKAEELFERATRAAPERSRLRGQAMLGRADALLKLGKNELAIELYKTVSTDLRGTPEGDVAKVALGELGVTAVETPPKQIQAVLRPTGNGQPAAKKEKEEEPEAAKAPPLAKEITADMSPEEKCLAVMAKHITDPGEAAKALNQLAREDPRSSCVYWHLGNTYTKLRDDRSALAAFRKYLELRPDAEKRQAVEDRIKTLATKLGER